jgi:hypothetical protein
MTGDVQGKRNGLGIGEAGRISASTPADEAEAERLQPTARCGTLMVKCDCGHTVPRSWVMSSSTGTSCPECYDRMSGEE